MTATPTLPQAFLERLTRIVPPPALATVVDSFRDPGPVVFRVNTLRGRAEETFAELEASGFPIERLPWPPYAARIPRDRKRALTETAAFAEGRIYIQSRVSMAAVEALAPEPGEEILDLCAAPGGKTSLLAMRMANRGRIAAVEPVKDRFHRLRANLARLGVEIARCYRMDGRAVGRKVPERFDRVLVDAPCATESRFRAGEPETFAHWSERKIAECARKQKRLLQAAFEALRPGGTLLYCTCSFAPEENEAVVDTLLRRHGDRAEILPLTLADMRLQAGLTEWRGRRFDPALRQAVRILPGGGDAGFFLCRLRKRD